MWQIEKKKLADSEGENKRHSAGMFLVYNRKQRRQEWRQKNHAQLSALYCLNMPSTTKEERKQLKHTQINQNDILLQKCMKRLAEQRKHFVQKLREATLDIEDATLLKEYQDALRARFDEIIQEECQDLHISPEEHFRMIKSLEEEIEREYEAEGMHQFFPPSF